MKAPKYKSLLYLAFVVIGLYIANFLFHFFYPKQYAALFYKRVFLEIHEIQENLEVKTELKTGYRCMYIEENWFGVESIFMTDLSIDEVADQLKSFNYLDFETQTTAGENLYSIVTIDLGENVLLKGEKIDWLGLSSNEPLAKTFRFKVFGKGSYVDAFDLGGDNKLSITNIDNANTLVRILIYIKGM